MGEPYVTNPSMPPAEYDKAFIKWVVNCSTLPSFYNGEKADTHNFTLDISTINTQTIKLMACVCRPGWADSEVVVRTFSKGSGKKPEKTHIVRGEDAKEEQKVATQDIRAIHGLSASDTKGLDRPSASDTSAMPPPSSDCSNIMAPPSSNGDED